jgi:hypothetical protein
LTGVARRGLLGGMAADDIFGTVAPAHRRRALCALALVAAAALVGATVLHNRRPPRPDAEREGQTWTPEDLLGYLNRRGLKVETAPVDNPPGFDAPQRWVAPGGESVFVRRFPAGPLVERLAAVQHPGSLVWGRFVILGDPGLIAELRAALAAS